MTRAEIKAAVLDLMGEDGGTGELLDRPMLQDTWLNSAADEIARKTWCFYTSLTQDTAPGQATYSAPEVFAIRSAYLADPAGSRLLPVTNSHDLDQSRPSWRTAQAGAVQSLVLNAANAISLYPPPQAGSLVFVYTDLAVNADGSVSSASRPFAASDTSLVLRVIGGVSLPPNVSGGSPTNPLFVPGVYTVFGVSATMPGAAATNIPCGPSGASGGQAVLTCGGLTLAGYGVPGASWPLSGSECPLPERAHMAVMWRTAIFRSIQFPSVANAARLPMLQGEYKQALGMLEREMHQLSDAQGFGDSNAFPFAGAFR